MRVTPTDAARMAGVSAKTAAKAVASGRIALGPDNLVEADTAVPELARHRAGRRSGGLAAAHEGVSLAEAQARKALADAKLAEYKLAQVEGVMMDVREVQAELDRTFTTIRQKLLSIPSRFAVLFAPRETPKAYRALDQVIRELLVELQHADDDQPPPAAPARRAA